MRLGELEELEWAKGRIRPPEGGRGSLASQRRKAAQTV